MREIERRYSGRPKVQLRRAADGRLKSAGEEIEVADIWAEQKRIHLAEAIAREKAKIAKRQRRKQLGLFKKAKSGHVTGARSGSKEIEVKLTLPKLNVARLARSIRKRVVIPRLSIKHRLYVAGGLILVVFIIATQGIYNKVPHAEKIKHSTITTSPTTPVGGTRPGYTTVLPIGKTIEQLGGWGRVSPPEKNPVFAYSDSVSSTHIVVSEQPLPENSQVSQIAKQFNASEKLVMIDGSIAYLATTSAGAQSLVISKSDLLILIRSSGKITNQVWVDYIGALQ